MAGLWTMDYGLWSIVHGHKLIDIRALIQQIFLFCSTSPLSTVDYAKNQRIFRTKGIWCLHRHGGEVGNRQLQDPDVVYLHFLPHHGLARNHLYDPRFLDQYQKLHPRRKKKSVEKLVKQTNRGMSNVQFPSIYFDVGYWTFLCSIPLS